MKLLCVLILTCAVLLPWSALTSAQVTPVVVDLDIKPDSDVNPINVKSKGRTEFAILGSLDFDTTLVDPTSLVVEDALASECVASDVNVDGFADLSCLVRTHEMGVVCGETEVALTGALLDGTLIEGSDVIKTVGCKHVKNKPPK